jgi:hypothetical protein
MPYGIPFFMHISLRMKIIRTEIYFYTGLLPTNGHFPYANKTLFTISINYLTNRFNSYLDASLRYSTVYPDS